MKRKRGQGIESAAGTNRPRKKKRGESTESIGVDERDGPDQSTEDIWRDFVIEPRNALRTPKTDAEMTVVDEKLVDRLVKQTEPYMLETPAIILQYARRAHMNLVTFGSGYRTPQISATIGAVWSRLRGALKLDARAINVVADVIADIADHTATGAVWFTISDFVDAAQAGQITSRHITRETLIKPVFQHYGIIADRESVARAKSVAFTYHALSVWNRYSDACPLLDPRFSFEESDIRHETASTGMWKVEHHTTAAFEPYLKYSTLLDRYCTSDPHTPFLMLEEAIPFKSRVCWSWLSPVRLPQYVTPGSMASSKIHHKIESIMLCYHVQRLEAAFIVRSTLSHALLDVLAGLVLAYLSLDQPAVLQPSSSILSGPLSDICSRISNNLGRIRFSQ